MKNITVAVNDRAWHDARVWAARRDTSLSKIVQDFLEALPTLPSAQGFPLPPCESETEPPVRTRLQEIVRKIVRETVDL